MANNKTYIGSSANDDYGSGTLIVGDGFRLNEYGDYEIHVEDGDEWIPVHDVLEVHGTVTSVE